jgi:beta-glucanase (GH16 family)
MGQTEEQACTKVSEQFPNGPCAVCNPLTCGLILDDPDPSKLIWNDEFNVDGAPNSTKWGYVIGDGCSQGICGWGNNELQYYTDSPENVVIANGVLRIIAKRDPQMTYGKEYTSARLVSKGKQTFRYGRIRLRARVAGCTATGTWPALWMLPENWVHGGWPDSGEIDIMEFVGYQGDKFHGSVHTEAYNHVIGTQVTASVMKPESDWHIFEIDWQVDKIRFAVDNEVYLVFDPEDINNSAQWPFHENFYLLLNVAVGGNWGGLKGVNATAFDGGQYMEVDWVRAYSS